MPRAASAQYLPTVEPEPLARHYVYMSRSSKGVWSDEDIESLVVSAQKHNRAAGIRGVLLVFRDYFMQWLEGPPDRIDELAAKIRVDERHTQFVELLNRDDRALLPRPWLTVRASRAEAAIDIERRFETLRAIQSDDGRHRLSPAAYLRAFALPAPVSRSNLIAYHAEKLKVVLAADDLVWPAAIVNTVARRLGAQPQRTLFSQPLVTNGEADGCVEYLDIAKSSTQTCGYRLSACASPTVNCAYAESVFADAHLVVFLVRASRAKVEHERLQSLLSLPCYTETRPHLMLLFSQAAESSRDDFLKDLNVDPDRLSVHTLSLSDSDKIVDLLQEKLDRVAASTAFTATSAQSLAPIAAHDLAETASIVKPRELYRVHDNTKPTALPPNVTASRPTPQPEEKLMANVSQILQSIIKIDGATACALVDYNSGMTLGTAGGGINIEVAAAGNTEVIRAKMKVAKALGLQDAIEDMLITLSNQYHVIRPVAAKPGLFFYVVIDRSKGNLAMARYQISDAEKALQM